MKSFLMSVLASKFGRADVETFTQAHPYHWLVWEPGDWKPSMNATVNLASPARISGIRAGESLCMALNAQRLVLGRNPGCDLPINDGTLSSQHIAFTQTPSGWTVEDLGSRNGTRVNGVALTANVPMAIVSGGQVLGANVNFTFYDAAGLWARLRKA